MVQETYNNKSKRKLLGHINMNSHITGCQDGTNYDEKNCLDTSQRVL